MTARRGSEVFRAVERVLAGARSPGTYLLRWLLIRRVGAGDAGWNPPRADD